MTLDPRFLQCTFRRLLQWRRDEKGQVIVLKPKLGTGHLARRLAALLGDPDYRIRLDEIGTLVWLACDGETRAEEIVRRMRAHFGRKVEPAEDRLHEFIMQLNRARMIEIRAS